MDNIENRLTFENVSLYVVYTSFLRDISRGFSARRELPQSWSIAGFEIPDPRVKRLFHQRYLDMMSPCKVVTLPSISLQGVDAESFHSIRWPDESAHSNIYKSLVQEKPEILADTSLQVEVRTFPSDFASFVFRFGLNGNNSAEHLVALANGLIDYDAKLNLTSGESPGLGDILRDTRSKLIQLGSSPLSEDSLYYESFSIIVPEQIKPVLPDARNYFKAPFSRALFAVAIRRGEFQEVPPEILEETQKNLSVYTSDIVVLNYHNALIYVKGELHMPPSAYVNLIVTMKTMAAMLHHYDLVTYKLLHNMRNIPEKFGELGAFARQLEELRLQVIQAIDTFRVLTSVSAVRARMLIDSAVQTFRIEPLVQSLEHKLEALNSLLSSQYSLQLSKRLQLLALLLGLFSFGAAVAGIIGFDRLVTFIQEAICGLHQMLTQGRSW